MALRCEPDKSWTGFERVFAHARALARFGALLVVVTLGAWAGRAGAATYCAFPGTSADPYSTYCGRIDWPTSGWRSVDRAYTEGPGDPNSSQADIVGDSTYPAMLVQKMWDTKLQRYFLYFRLRVNYQGLVTVSDQSPFKYGDNNSSTYYWMFTTASASPLPLYAVAWDLRAGAEAAHGLEMTFRKEAAPTLWEGFYFDDVDGTQNGKCAGDIDGSGTPAGGCTYAPENNDGFVRLIESQTGPPGNTPNTFIEMAISCTYFADVQARFAAQRGAFNPCSESFLSSAAIVYRKADNQSLGASDTDIYGIPAFTTATTISSNVWGASYNPTAAVVTDFRSWPAGKGVDVTWQTASEFGTVGFNLHRVEPGTGSRVQVNRHLVAALEGSPNGGRYLVWDPGAPAHAESTYLLEEIEHGGTIRTYGPFEVRPGSAGAVQEAPEVGESGWTRMQRSDDAGAAGVVRSSRDADQSRGHAPASRKSRARHFSSQAGSTSGAARVIVAEEGLQALTSTSVAAALGIGEEEARSAIRHRRLRLSGPDGPVACEAARDGSRLHFHGKPLDTTWADTAVYWLTRGECRAFDRRESGRTGGPAPGTFVFVDRAHVEQDKFALPLLFRDSRDDFWLWTQFVAGHPTLGAASYALTTPASTGGDGELTVNLQGETASSSGRDHHVRVVLNGSPLGDVRWAGEQPAAATFSVPAGGFTAPGGNEARVEAILDASVPWSVVGLESFDVTWRRRAVAEADRLLLPRGVSGDVVVDGLGGDDAWVLDLADPARPARLDGVAVGRREGATYLRFRADPARGPYLVVRPGIAAVPALESVSPAVPLHALRHRGIDYLVLTSPELAAAAEELAALREAGGLRAAVITTDRIYDAYRGGNLDPEAIRDFLADVHRTWSPRPRFVVLAGSGTFDGRGIVGTNDNHVPPMLAVGTRGLGPSDVAFADVEGDDGVPEFAIGRIPAATPEQLVGYVAKLRAYEADAGGWASRAFFLADDADAGGEFPADSANAAAGMPPPIPVQQVSHAGDVGATRARVKEALEAGVGLFHYFGHAAVDRLGNEGFLTSSDVDLLANGSRTPIALLMTCGAGRYAYPGYESLAMRLTGRPGGGAIATIAASSLQWEADGRVLSQGILESLLAPGADHSLGTAFVRGLAASRDAGGSIELRRTYTLFGDPAVGLHR